MTGVRRNDWGDMEQEMLFPPRHSVRVEALYLPGTGPGFLGTQGKAVALAASVLNIVGTVTPGLPGNYALDWGPTDPGDRRASLSLPSPPAGSCRSLPVSAMMTP